MGYWHTANHEGHVPVAFRSGQGTILPLPGWAVSTLANFEWLTAFAGAYWLQPS